MRGRRRPSGAPGEARRIDSFGSKLPVTAFACPSFLPAPPNYSQFHLVTLLGPPPKVTLDKTAVPRLLEELEVKLRGEVR